METGTHRDTGETWRQGYIETGTHRDDDIVTETGTHENKGETWRRGHNYRDRDTQRHMRDMETVIHRDRDT